MDRVATGLTVPEEAAKARLLDEVGRSIGARAADTWLTAEGSDTVLYIGVASPTQADQAAVEAARGRAGFGRQVRVVPVPAPKERLDEYHAAVLKVADRLDLGITIAPRPDVGRLEITLEPEDATDANIAELEAVVPECTLSIQSGDAIVEMTFSRGNMPPYKAGKTVKMLAYPEDSICTGAFIYELNGSSTLRVATAGHCTQQVVAIWDGDQDTKLGDTVTPNIFRRSSPADGDGVLIDPTLPDSDLDRYLIIDSDSQALVAGKRTQDQLSLGDTVYKSGKTTGETGGTISLKDVTITVSYYDFVARQQEEKQVENLDKATYTAASGDSGGPVYVYLAGPPLKVASVGIVSAGTGPSYFYPASYLGDELGAHIWLG